MRRTRGGADARLHDLWSIGVGGHLNPGDDGVLGGLRREWHEEVEAAFDPQPRFVGLLNDDTTPVGRVHLGLVFEIEAAGRPVAVRETDKLSGGFAPTEPSGPSPTSSKHGAGWSSSASTPRITDRWAYNRAAGP